MELKQLRPLVNNELWTLYMKYTEEVLKRKTSELINAEESLHIHRVQGDIKRLQEILSLRDKANAS